MQIPLLAWIFQGIPECIALAAVVMSLASQRVTINLVLKIGVAQAVISYLIRLIPFTPGVHVILLVTSLGVLSVLIGKMEIKQALVYSAMVVGLLVIFELISNLIGVRFGLYTFEQVQNSLMMRILVGYPNIVFLALLSFLILKKKINITPMLFKNSD